jgi:para-aminobenzoate synthetase component I
MWSYDTFTLASLTREKCLHAARYFASKEGTCFLYSGGCLDSAQTSYLGLFPFETLSIQLNQVSDPWQILKGFFGNQHPLDYAFGFIGYEMGAFSDFEKRLPYQEAQTPDAYWQRCAVVLIVDHRENKSLLPKMLWHRLI